MRGHTNTAFAALRWEAKKGTLDMVQHRLSARSHPRLLLLTLLSFCREQTTGSKRAGKDWMRAFIFARVIRIADLLALDDIEYAC